MNVFLLSVSVSANVRQSTQIKMQDLKLPQSVIQTLEEQQSVSVRPNLSGKLKEFLGELRLMQRQLYDECTIHRGDAHFLHPDNFEDAMQRIKEIRSRANELNETLRTLWVQEYEKWQSTVANFVDPLFSDESDRVIVKEAYLKLFPTREEFKAPIDVFVVGPCPVDLEVAESADDHSLSVASLKLVRSIPLRFWKLHKHLLPTVRWRKQLSFLMILMFALVPKLAKDNSVPLSVEAPGKSLRNN